MFSVALIGPDGSGKTTVARKLKRALPMPSKYLYMGINAEASNRMLPTTRLWHLIKRTCGAKPDTAGPPDSKKTKQRSKNPLKRTLCSIKSFLGLVNRVADEWYRQCLVWYYQSRGLVVLFDRHFLFDFYSYDVAANGNPRPWASRIHGLMLSKLYPKPDLVIFLDAPGEVLFARKGEGTPELLEQRRWEYRKIGSLVKNFSIVDATLPESEVLEQVCDRISKFYQKRSGVDQKQLSRKVATRRAKPTVLVTDARLGSAVSIIRSLGRKGYRVIAADSDPRSPGLRSRYTHRKMICPNAETEPSAFAESMAEAVSAYNVDLIIPLTDEAILALQTVRENVEPHCQLAIPDTVAMQTTSSKFKTQQLAESLDIPTPKTELVTTAAHACQVVGPLGWPVVLKPQTSRLFGSEGGIEMFEVCYAENLEQLNQRMLRFEGRCPVLLQEYCRGVGYGVELLTYKGRPLAAFQHKRLREIPISGGASAFRESVPLDPVLYQHATRLLESIKWTGLAMVEFKVDGGEAKLMEINGRVWGSLPLAVHCGVDFPAMLAELYLQGPPGNDALPVTSYPIGVRTRNLRRDLMWIASVLLGRKKYPYLEFPRKREALAALLGMLNPASTFDVLSIRDPRPGIAELARIVRTFRSKMREDADRRST